MSERIELQSDSEFVKAFFECRLASADFDHRGHLRIAWLLLDEHPLSIATDQVCIGIERIAAHFGAPGKFNRTMTVALVRLIAEAKRRSARGSFAEFLEAHPALLRDVRGLLAQHYSADVLTSPRAKVEFVEPDLRPLP